MLSVKATKCKRELEEFSRLKRQERNLKIYLEEIIEMGRLIRKSDSIKVDMQMTDTNPEKVNFWMEKRTKELAGILGRLMGNEDIVLSRLEQVRLRDGRSYNLLFSRYVLGKSYESIAYEDFHFDPRHIYRMLNDALEIYSLTSAEIDLNIFDFPQY
jgi:hypothetical protein